MRYFEKIAFELPPYAKFADDEELYQALRGQKNIKRLYTVFKKLGVEDTFDEALRKKTFGNIGGTIYKTPEGKKVLINKRFENEDPKLLKNVLHHETFHAKVPVVGGSELLAHLYGGFRSGDKFTGEYGAFGQFKHFAKTRPERLILEPGLVLGAGFGVHHIIKKNKKK